MLKMWLPGKFSMKHLGQPSDILGLKLYRDKPRRHLGLSQFAYMSKILGFIMQDFRKVSLVEKMIKSLSLYFSKEAKYVSVSNQLTKLFSQNVLRIVYIIWD